MDARNELRLDAPDRGAAALEAEVAVIGSVLFDGQCMGRILPELEEDDFLHAPYRHVFAAMKAMFLSGQPVDRVTLSGRPGIDTPQMLELLRQCEIATPTAANAVVYGRRI